MFSSIFVKLKPFLKLLLALGIAAGLVGAIYYAQQEANRQMAEFEQTKDKDGAMGEEVAVKEYELKEVDENNQLRWQLKAASGILEPRTKDVDLKGIEVKYYNEGQVSLNIQAPVGKANELTHIILLKSDKDNKVLAMGVSNQTKMEVAEMELNKKNQFKATGGVNIEWPGVAKVTGDSAEGVISQVKLIEHIVLRGNTHSTIGM